MRARGYLSRVALSCVVLAAVSCGSDKSDSTDMAVTSVSAGSRSEASGGSPAKDRSKETPEQCVTETTDVFAMRSDGYGDACVSCLCEKSPSTIALCNDQAEDCWGLIGCVGSNCKGKKDMDESDCAVAMCGQFIEGAALAMSIGVLLQGDACSAQCPSMPLATK